MAAASLTRKAAGIPWRPATSTQTLLGKSNMPVRFLPSIAEKQEKTATIKEKKEVVAIPSSNKHLSTVKLCNEDIPYPTTGLSDKRLEATYEGMIFCDATELNQRASKPTDPTVNKCFGEIRLSGMRKLCAAVNMNKCRLFADLGAGYGRQGLFVFLEYPRTNVYGVEYDEHRYAVAAQAIKRLCTENPKLFHYMQNTAQTFVRAESRVFGNTIQVHKGNLLDHVHVFTAADVLFCEVSFAHTGQRPLLQKRLHSMKPGAHLLLYENMSTVYATSSANKYKRWFQENNAPDVQTTWSSSWQFPMYVRTKSA